MRWTPKAALRAPVRAALSVHGMDKILDQFFKLPLWAKLLIGFVIICMLDGLRLAWGEHRFVANFAEATLAVALYWGSVFGSFGLGIFTGIKTTDKSNSTKLGWVIGILVFLIVGVGSGLLISQIPGVGWRYDLMMSSD